MSIGMALFFLWVTKMTIGFSYYDYADSNSLCTGLKINILIF